MIYRSKVYLKIDKAGIKFGFLFLDPLRTTTSYLLFVETKNTVVNLSRDA